jgi:hypothetical protein
MILSAVSVLVVVQSSSEIQEGLMNNPVLEERDFKGKGMNCWKFLLVVLFVIVYINKQGH